MLGILGGTFDPIHFGHLRTALEVAEHFILSDMRLIPGKVPPHRAQPQASPEQRLTMLQLALAAEPRLHADDRELAREGYSYTIDTVLSLREEVGNECPILLTLGVDAFLNFQTWHRWQAILAQVHLVVVQRPGYSLPPAGWYTPHLTQQVATVSQQPAGYIYPLTVTALTISATAIRKLLKNGQSPRYLLPDIVIDYIRHKQLYCGTAWN